MSEKKVKIHVNRKITPIALVADKFDDFEVKDLIVEVDHKTLVIMNEIKENYELNEDEASVIEQELSYILSNFLIYQVEMHGNIFLDDFAGFLIEIINHDIKHFISENKIDNPNINKKPTLYSSIQKSFLEVCKFHDTLFFSDVITLDDCQELNNIHIQAMLSIHYKIIDYLKKNKNNDIDYIYQTTLLVDEVYSNTLINLFDYLISNEKLLSNYKKNINKYLDKTKDMFLEKYSIIININSKYYKKIIKND